MPFADGSFDLVISYASLHHWRQPAAVINEIMRVLKENGRVIIRDNRRVTGQPFWEVVGQADRLLDEQKTLPELA